MLNMKFKLVCKDCGEKAVFEGRTLRRIHDLARDEGWAISRDCKKQWCPKCAVNHRHTGKKAED
ncbi:MAG: hypothetical protein ACI4MB_05735 [Candidatus Coproplasma sp.]